MPGAAESARASAIAAEAWLRTLEFPRPNGSASLDSAVAFLQTSLTTAGLEPRSLAFDCHLHRTLAATGVLLVSAVYLALAVRRRRRRLALATLALWLVALGCLGGVFDFLLPARPQACLLVSVESLAPAQHEVLLSAHMDSKSEPLDHVGRTLLLAFTVVSCAWTWLRAVRRRTAHRWPTLCAVIGLLGMAAQLSMGRWLPARSPGIVDDAGACVLLAELAVELHQHPLQRTRLHFLWTTGEEVGLQGAAAAARHPRFPKVHRFINLEGIGAGSDVADAAWEMVGWQPQRSHASTRDILRHCSAESLRSLPFPIWSDAGALRAAGLTGVTLLNLQPRAATIRGLHGPADRLERFDWTGYARMRALLRCGLDVMDASR